MKEPIRVAQVIGHMVNGGVEHVVFNYYRNINHDNIQYDFYYDTDSTVEPPADIVSAGGRFVLIPSYENLFQYISALTRHFKENNYKIVHVHMNTLSVFALFAAVRAGVPVRICHSHSTAASGETMRNLLKYILRPFASLFATDLFACSKLAGEWLYGKEKMKNVKVWLNAIDVRKFAYYEGVREIKRKGLGIADDEFVLGHVGRCVFAKNHEFLVNIFAKFHKKHTKSKLLLVGDGPLKKDIENKVKSLELSSSVIFTGNSQDVAELYSAMDCFAFPSRYEGLGMVLVEAQANGLPCLASTDVPEEACVTSLVKRLDLNAGVDAWVKAIENAACDRNTTVEINSDFKIDNVARNLEAWYLDHV